MRDFQEIQEFDVIEEGNIGDKETQILYMTVSECQTRMGILLGKDLGRGRIDTTHLQIYENGTIGKTWKKMLSQKFDFDHACREFVFSNQNKEEVEKRRQIIANFQQFRKARLAQFNTPEAIATRKALRDGLDQDEHHADDTEVETVFERLLKEEETVVDPASVA